MILSVVVVLLFYANYHLLPRPIRLSAQPALYQATRIKSNRANAYFRVLISFVIYLSGIFILSNVFGQ